MLFVSVFEKKYIMPYIPSLSYLYATIQCRIKPVKVQCTHFRLRVQHIIPGGGGHSTFIWTCRWGVENLTLSQTARRTKKYTLS